MSNHLAIAAVTATLHVRLRQALQLTGLNADVSHTRPGTTNAFPNQVGMHLFLYMVTPNAALRNADLPTRDGRGRVLRRPTAALELHYLLSFLGDETQHEPQRMLGAVASELHASPVLLPDEIRDAVAGGVLEGSRLEQQIERVKLTPEAIDLEEFSKLWSVFFQTQYLLSVAYKASVVLVEAEVAVPAVGRVRDRGIYSAPLPPAIASLAPQVAQAGARVAIRGTSFMSDTTVVRFVREDGSTVEVVPAVLLDDRLEVVLPAELPAGMHAVRIVTRHETSSGTLPPRTFALESGPVPFMLAPRIVGSGTADELETLVEVESAAGSTVVVDVVPVILEDQDVLVLLGLVQTTPEEQVTEDGFTRLTFVIPSDSSFEPGQSHPLRVQVDRAVSLVEPDGDRFMPRLTVTGGP